MKKAVIYARYSSDKQTEQSIEGQLYDCHNYAREHDIQIVGEYIDRAMTGKNDDRPQFQQMLADSAKGEFELVLVWKLDRFARNTTDAAINRYTLKKNNVRLVSAMEQFGDDPAGDMMVHVVEAMNEYYSADLRQKTLRGMKQSALKCESTGHIPLGYKVVDKKYVIDPDTVYIPETVFRMYAAGERLIDIAQHLNDMGYRTRKGKPFTVNSFYSMLSNEKYTGVYKFGDVRIEKGMPAIVNEEVFEFVRKRLADNRKRAAKNTAKADYFLSGKLFCGHCGQPMSGMSSVGRNGVKHYYYRCNGAAKKTCDKHLEKKELIESEVCKAAYDAFANIGSEEFARIITERMEETFSRDNIRALENELVHVDMQLEKVVDAIANVGGNQVLYDKLNALTEQKESIQRSLVTAHNAYKDMPTFEQIKIIVDDVLALDMNTREGQKALADLMINKVYVYDDRIIVIFRNKDGNSVELSLADISKATAADCTPSAQGSHIGQIRTAHRVRIFSCFMRVKPCSAWS